MPKLTPVSWRKLVKRLRDLGYKGPIEGGKHPYMIRGNVVLAIPNPHLSVIGVDLLQKILQRAGLTREQWQSEWVDCY